MTNQVEEKKISDLVPDPRNANRGTERGQMMLDASLRELGAGRSILVDKQGRIIAGNKTAERAADVGIEDVVIVRTDGKKLVAVLREDLDLDSDEARRLAYYDNRVAEVDLVWDADMLQFDEELLEGLFSDRELEIILENANKSEDMDLSQYDSVSDVDIHYKVVVEELSLEQAEMLAEELRPDYAKVKYEQVRVQND